MKRCLALLFFILAAVGCGSRVSIGELPPGIEETSNPTIPGSGGENDAAVDAGGGRVPPPPVDGGGDSANDAGPAPWTPCGGKACGQSCSQCSPNDPNCVETAVLKFCHANGDCNATTPTCPPYEPCANKVCGASCTICSPTDLNCFETAVLKECSVTGQCIAGTATCI